MEEDIKVLEEFLEEIKEILERIDDYTNLDTYAFPIDYKQTKAIENLIARNKELEKHFQEFYNAEVFTAKQVKLIEKDYILKAKVREKIEEANKEIKQMEQDDTGIGFTLGNRWSDLKAKVKGWEELLQEGDK